MLKNAEVNTKFLNDDLCSIMLATLFICQIKALNGFSSVSKSFICVVGYIVAFEVGITLYPGVLTVQGLPLLRFFKNQKIKNTKVTVRTLQLVSLFLILKRLS
ncbi:hypothetical protein BpHYR1_048673 [Brachionus plicatilis]|uniref:Uncharacterized protein n=1 Tax=Brachionus plicatilis TaxID=10195 RepID=A0A3M7QP39_BRAPC|nr:hypothetical protein BpHYR1_048673 [Brachionus plicatilis]